LYVLHALELWELPMKSHASVIIDVTAFVAIVAAYFVTRRRRLHAVLRDARLAARRCDR
jgi:hypothetical protein